MDEQWAHPDMEKDGSGMMMLVIMLSRSVNYGRSENRKAKVGRSI